MSIAYQDPTKLAAACEVVSQSAYLLLDKKDDAARQLIEDCYPLAASPAPLCSYSGQRVQEPLVDAPERRRNPTPARLVDLHRRDRHVDRYTGAPVISPIVLKLLGHPIHGPLSNELPYHVNGGRGGPSAGEGKHVCHQVGFELFASYEHVRPLAAGGLDTMDNLVTSSHDTNSQKGTETWEPVVPLGTGLDGWDGLTGWFLAYTERRDCRWLNGLSAWRNALAK